MTEKLNLFHLGILCFMTQTGVAAFSLSQALAQYFGTNGWLALILISAVVTINIYLLSLVYRWGEGRSIFDILEQAIPQIILFPIYIGLVTLWALLGSMVSKQYLLLYQMISFPTTSPMLFKLFLDFVSMLLLMKGLQAIARASTFFFWLIVWMAFLLLFFIPEIRLVRYTPHIFQDGGSWLQGALSVYGAFLGYELTILLFPYIERKTSYFKGVFWGNFGVTLTYLSFSVVAFGFFSLGQLKMLQFPLLDMLAFIRLPFIERLENLLYGFILFTTVITIVMYWWAALETSMRLFVKGNKKLNGFLIAAGTYIISFIPDSLPDVQNWLKLLGMVETILTFGLPLVLIVLLSFERVKGGRRHVQN